MAKLNRIATTSQRLHQAMEMERKKQTDIVALTGINKGTISRYCSGEIEPKATAINKLATALNVAEMWLWGYDVPMERSEGQKKNDQLVKLVTRLRSDSEFMDAVQKLDNLTPAQYAAVLSMLNAMS